MTPHRHQQPPGAPECLRYAVAELLAVDVGDVPHFEHHPDVWWSVLRRWTRHHGGDWWPLTPVDGGTPDGTVRPLLEPPYPAAVLAAGPSPRAERRRHCVVTDPDLVLLHDPHPSGAGLLVVDEVYVLVDPYDPAPDVPGFG